MLFRLNDWISKEFKPKATIKLFSYFCPPGGSARIVRSKISEHGKNNIISFISSGHAIVFIVFDCFPSDPVDLPECFRLSGAQEKRGLPQLFPVAHRTLARHDL